MLDAAGAATQSLGTLAGVDVPPKLKAEYRPAQGGAVGAVELFRTRMRELVASHHGSNPRIFGSVARGDDGEGSDIDLLVDFDTEATYLDLVGLRLDLEELVGIPVHVAHDNGNSPVLVQARKEAVPL